MSWITIADARALTVLGLAQRGQQGWTITEAGLAAYKAQLPTDVAAGSSAEVTPYR